ncbi:hypothetical protein DPEC_G00364420 [Dallia pectoralis]|nr:hypothetical protein DPEC_G00364420 [Dallia pectoralis]
MISEGKEVLLVRQFLGEVTKHPRLALERLKSHCKDLGLLQIAKSVTKQLEQTICENGDTGADEAVTELGCDVKLVCNYPSSVSVAHLEETLSMWTNYWRSALSGFSQFNRRHNTIQYNNRDTLIWEEARRFAHGQRHHAHAGLAAPDSVRVAIGQQAGS